MTRHSRLLRRGVALRLRRRNMASKHSSVPAGLNERTADWHFTRFVEFTGYKGEIGEPSPHLAIVGYLSKKMSLEDKLWLLGCYAATYCLPSAQVLWSEYPLQKALKGKEPLESWLTKHWKGIVTRTERRCVRTPRKMAECLHSFSKWATEEYPKLTKLKAGELSRENYDVTWESVEQIKYFGRYINIRLIEGLRRYCGVPARLYDIRSIGGWSPKRCLCYLFPEHTEKLLVDDAYGNELTDELAMRLLARVQKKLGPEQVDEYVLAAMLCEYKGAFENRHQYPSWTIDQEPLLYDKVFDYWGETVDRKVLWKARKALFPKECLGELNGWNGTRWELAKTLRDHGYNWTDLMFNYMETAKRESWAKPVRWY